MAQIKTLLAQPRSRAILVGIVALVVIAAIYLALAAAQGLPPFSAPEVSMSNTQILLDRSLAMQEPFESGTTKIEAAIQVINDTVLNQPVVVIPAW